MENYDLKELADAVMRQKGLEVDLSRDAEEQLARIVAPASCKDCEDFRSLLWCSIDNDDSFDLDQLTYAEKNQGGYILWIAIADVDALVPKGSPIDQHARMNTTSVYTPDKIFPMLPEKLSTNLTSLNEEQDRVAIVVKLEMDNDGKIAKSTICRAVVYNHAKLTYNAVGGWLAGEKEIPEKIIDFPELQQVLLIQHQAAQILKQRRHRQGSLTLDSPELEAHIEENRHIILELPGKNFAHQLIENFMIAANYCMAKHLRDANIASLRRVVRVPERWEKIVELAFEGGERLPNEPNALALERFLIKQKEKDPETFPDLSLMIIKLIGRGEYVVEEPETTPIGHFALAVIEYTHSTAPNRRYPDLVTQRQYKAFLEGKYGAYTLEELRGLANHCTEREDVANKVERHMNKAVAALFLKDKIGEAFKGIITGKSDKGIWVRILTPPIEGRVVRGFENLDVGDRIEVILESVDVIKAHINFIRK